MKLLLYCTKDRYKHLYDLTYVNNGEIMFAVTQHNKYSLVADNYVNEKIVATCECRLVERIIDCGDYEKLFRNSLRTHKCENQQLCIRSCLSNEDLEKYLDVECEDDFILYYHDGYASHLENVQVFAQPKKLSDYGLKRAPQNMCYCYDENGNKCILLSIHPEPLRDIVNGKKTIEVRRKILKELKELMK